MRSPTPCPARQSLRATSRGAAVLALAMLALVAQTGGVLHLVLVQHVTCPEHGEWVHAPSAGALAAAVSTPTPGHDTPAVEKSTADEKHVHDHCSATCTRRDDVVSQRPGVTLQAFLQLTQAPLHLQAAVAPAIALLRLAPKASPPA